MGINTISYIGNDRSCFQRMKNEMQARKDAAKKTKETTKKKEK